MFFDKALVANTSHYEPDDKFGGKNLDEVRHQIHFYTLSVNTSNGIPVDNLLNFSNNRNIEELILALCLNFNWWPFKDVKVHKVYDEKFDSSYVNIEGQ